MYTVYTNRYRSNLSTVIIGHNIIGRFTDMQAAIEKCKSYAYSGYNIGRVFVVSDNGEFITSRKAY